MTRPKPAVPPPVAVRTAGLVDRRPWHSTPGTRLDDVMLTVVTHGRGSYQQRGEVQVVTAGMIGLVPPTDPGVLAADPSEPYVHFYCRFNGAYALHLAELILAQRGGRRFVVDPRCEAIARRMPELGSLSRRDRLPTIMGRAELCLTGILLDLLDDVGAATGAADELTADGLREYLQSTIDQPTHLAGIAAHFGVSVRTLTRRCRAWTGLSVQRLHEDLKLAWARTLLRGTDDDIATIARRTGYTDPAYFSRVFRRSFGRSPSLFRR